MFGSISTIWIKVDLCTDLSTVSSVDDSCIFQWLHLVANPHIKRDSSTFVYLHQCKLCPSEIDFIYSLLEMREKFDDDRTNCVSDGLLLLHFHFLTNKFLHEPNDRNSILFHNFFIWLFFTKHLRTVLILRKMTYQHISIGCFFSCLLKQQ